MKTRNVFISLILLTGISLAGTAQAAGKFYIGAKAGIVKADISGFDEAINAGVYGGYNLLGKDSHFAADLSGGALAVEGEVTTTLIKGDAGFADEWDMTSIAAYAAYRHPVTDYFYLKGKLGLVRYEIDTSLPPPASITSALGTETKLAAGVGVGWKVGPGSLEVDLTTYESDVLFLAAGFHLSF